MAAKVKKLTIIKNDSRAKDSKETKDPGKNRQIFEKLYKLNLILATVFLLLWIFIGGFFSFTIFQNLQMLAKQSNLAPVKNTPQNNLPQETVLPGVGKVNVECVQKEINPETIQKIFADNSVANLTEEEKTKLGPCIVEREATPSASPSPTQ